MPKIPHKIPSKKPNLLKTLEDILFWCEQDRDNEDGYPTQEMFEARVHFLRVAIHEANRTNRKNSWK